MTRLSAGELVVAIDADRGGRLRSLQFAGHELLVGAHAAADGTTDPMGWGCFPMVPWAGRVRDGCFTFDHAEYRLPVGLPPHAIHGTGYVQAWTWIDERTLHTELDRDWPFGGSVEQRFDVTDNRLHITMTVRATQAMPAMVGWHPWFRRSVAGVAAQLDFAPRAMYELDDDEIPTGGLVPVPAGPWDNCFVGMAADPVVRWPGVGQVQVSSSCDHWVVYDQPDHALCVEPQTGAPDEFNRRPRLVTPDTPLVATMTLTCSP